jgi:hypothetical protein
MAWASNSKPYVPVLYYAPSQTFIDNAVHRLREMGSRRVMTCSGRCLSINPLYGAAMGTSDRFICIDESNHCDDNYEACLLMDIAPRGIHEGMTLLLAGDARRQLYVGSWPGAASRIFHSLFCEGTLFGQHDKVLSFELPLPRGEQEVECRLVVVPEALMGDRWDEI